MKPMKTHFTSHLAKENIFDLISIVNKDLLVYTANRTYKYNLYINITQKYHLVVKISTAL